MTAVDRVLVPFGGAVARLGRGGVGAWLARNTSSSLRLVGASGGIRGVTQAACCGCVARRPACFGVPAEPLLVEPDAEALLAAASDAGAVVVGPDRALAEGGPRRSPHGARHACAAPTLWSAAVCAQVGSRRAGTETHFTWTSRPSAPQANLQRTSSGRRHRRADDAEVPRPDHRRTRDASHESRAHGTGRRLRDRARGRRSALPARPTGSSGKQITVDADAGISKMRGGLIGDWRGTSFEELGRSPLYHARGTETVQGLHRPAAGPLLQGRSVRHARDDVRVLGAVRVTRSGVTRVGRPASTRSSRARATSRARRASSRWSTADAGRRADAVMRGQSPSRWASRTQRAYGRRKPAPRGRWRRPRRGRPAGRPDGRRPAGGACAAAAVGGGLTQVARWTTTIRSPGPGSPATGSRS